MKISFKSSLNAMLLSSVLVASHTALATDKELLDTLLQNGVLTKAQHEKLITQAEEKAPKRTTTKPSGGILEMDWASRIKISGDMRVRYEDKHSDAKGVHESRQRIRARIGLAAKINEDVDVGFRLVTSGGRSTSNQDLEGGFVGKSIFFDRAFIDWHPSFAPGMHVIAGKIKQPWYGIKQGLIWDTDVNPEGLAVTYKKDFGQARIKTTAGYFIVEDGKNLVEKGENNGFSEDQKMFHAGISGEMKITDKVKGSLGFNAFIYDDAVGNDKKNLNTDAEIYSVAGKVDIKTGLMPIKVYGQYAVNVAASDHSQNTAWLAGIGTKFKNFSLDYNYRDTQEYAVVDIFNDSDFAEGNTGSRGHKIKVGYKISKNFFSSVSYYAAKEYGSHNVDNNEINILHVDFKAKF
ncbi:MAG: putative porin [Methylococcales bacterium]|nr:putative porin [Methylococcales bacterium]